MTSRRFDALSAEIDDLLSALKRERPRSSRAAELAYRLKLARTKRLQIGLKMKRQELRKDAA